MSQAEPCPHRRNGIASSRQRVGNGRASALTGRRGPKGGHLILRWGAPGLHFPHATQTATHARRVRLSRDQPCRRPQRAIPQAGRLARGQPVGPPRRPGRTAPPAGCLATGAPAGLAGVGQRAMDSKGTGASASERYPQPPLWRCAMDTGNRVRPGSQSHAAERGPSSVGGRR